MPNSIVKDGDHSAVVHRITIPSSAVLSKTIHKAISLFIYYYFILAPQTFFSFFSSSFNRHSSICAAIPTELILLLVPILQQIMEEKKKTKFGSKYTCNIFFLIQCTYNTQHIHTHTHSMSITLLTWANVLMFYRQSSIKG